MGAVVNNGSWIYGMQLPVQTLTRTLVDPWEDEATVADLVTIARKAEATGHAFVGVCDHVAIPDNEYAARMTTTWYDTIATLAYLAAHTTDRRRTSAILGVGAGHVEAEFEALGIDFSTRGKRLDETIDAVRGAFTDRYVSHQGEFYSYHDVGVAPGPASGELPIWVGGSGAAAWRRTGRAGDGYIPMGNSAAQYPEIVSTIRAAAEQAGRGDASFDIGYMPGWAHLTGPRTDDLPPAMIIGAEALAEDMRAARAAGANVMHMKFRGRTLEEYLDQLDAFQTEVVPLID